MTSTRSRFARSPGELDVPSSGRTSPKVDGHYPRRMAGVNGADVRGRDGPTQAPTPTRSARGFWATLHVSSVRAILLFLVLLACGCDAREAPGPSSAQQWAAARALWYIDRDPAAYEAWRAVDPGTPEGREARALLREAEPVYLEGIEQVSEGVPEARATLQRGVRIGPMDPELYLPLARAFRARALASPDNPHLFIRAAEYYRKFLLRRPNHAEAAAARDELAAIDPEGSRIFAPRQDVAPAPVASVPEEPVWPLPVALVALVLAVVATLMFALRGRSRASLRELAARRPELHPAIAYLTGSLRHELLKHRIGAVGNAVDALAAGDATEAQRTFLEERLFGGEPLVGAWEGHLAAFERALGPELGLHRDPVFRRADRAVRQLAALRGNLGGRGASRMAAAHRALRALDAELSEWVRGLVRTPVDGSLLRAVVDEVRTEYAAGQVELAEVVIRAPEPAPLVEVFRVDLVLVLKNVVRNAILAVADEPAPRRLGLTISTEVEPTGEETVSIHVLDTATATFTTEDIYQRRIDRGLGLVTAALRRYDGAIHVEPGAEGFAKAVTVRFFRAYAEDDVGPPSATS